MKTKNNTIVGWRTRKLTDGTFAAIVYELTAATDAAGNHVSRFAELKRVPGWSTRARAKANAIQWMRYLTHQINEAAA